MAARDASTLEEEEGMEDEKGQEVKAASSAVQKVAASYWAGVGSTRDRLAANCASLLYIDSLLITPIV